MGTLRYKVGSPIWRSVRHSRLALEPIWVGTGDGVCGDCQLCCLIRCSHLHATQSLHGREELRQERIEFPTLGLRDLRAANCATAAGASVVVRALSRRMSKCLRDGNAGDCGPMTSAVNAGDTSCEMFKVVKQCVRSQRGSNSRP